MAKKRFARLIEERFGKTESKIYAELGDYNGVVETGVAYQVYARDRVGQVIRVYNYSVPNVAGLKVEIGRVAGQGTWQVIGARNAYQNPSLPNIPSHDSLHRYLPIYRDQILPLMFLPTDDPFVIQIFGSVVVVDNVWAFVDNQTLDLTSYVPAAGALYVTLQYDTSGVVSVVTGSTKASKEILVIADVPAAAANHILFGAVRLYDNQETLDRSNDLLYPFNVSGVSTGGLPPLDADRIVVTDPAGDLTTDESLYYDTVNNEIVFGDISGVPAHGSKVFQAVGDGISPALLATAYGSSFAPFLTFFKADGSLATPTNVKSGQVIGRVRARGYDGSAWSNTQAEIRFVAAADWSGTSHPINIEFYTTDIDSTTLTLRLTIYSDGRIWVADSGRVSADNGLAFHRTLERNLVLQDDECLVTNYITFNDYDMTLEDDGEVLFL